MTDGLSGLLDNPAVQAGVVPFVVALLLALPLARTRWLALASGSGVVVLLMLTVGFAFVPMTSVRKMTLVVLLAILLGLVLAAMHIGLRRATVVWISASSALASVWMLQRIIEQAQGQAGWWMAIAAALFVLAMSAAALAASADPLRASVIGTALGWGSGALAVLGASALLGQLGIALGTACAAAALGLLVRGSDARHATWTVVLPVAIGAPLIAVLAVATGELRGFQPLPLLLVAPAAALINVGDRKPWAQALLQGLAALVPVVIAIVLTALTSSSSSAAG